MPRVSVALLTNGRKTFRRRCETTHNEMGEKVPGLPSSLSRLLINSVCLRWFRISPSLKCRTDSVVYNGRRCCMSWAFVESLLFRFETGNHQFPRVIGRKSNRKETLECILCYETKPNREKKVDRYGVLRARLYVAHKTYTAFHFISSEPGWSHWTTVPLLCVLSINRRLFAKHQKQCQK